MGFRQGNAEVSIFERNEMIDPKLLEIIACPDDGSRLKPAKPGLVAEINRRISAGEVNNRGGAQVTETIDEGLVREDEQWWYPVRDEIPVMLVDEAIPLETGNPE